VDKRQKELELLKGFVAKEHAIIRQATAQIQAYEKRIEELSAELYAEEINTFKKAHQS
jgi:hypothetical protein